MRRGIAKALAWMMVVMLILSMTAFAAEKPSNSFQLPPVSVKETVAPTQAPTAEPSPTAKPTEAPTAEPTEAPTAEPTEEPSPAPTEEPSPAPTAEPTQEPIPMPEAEYNCGLAEHAHGDECYADGELTCELAEHAHDELCLAEVAPVSNIIMPYYNNLDDSLLTCGNNDPGHIHTSACCEERDLLKYLPEAEWSIHFYDPATDEEVQMGEDGVYVFEKGKQYKLKFEADCNNLAMGRFYIRFPAGMDGSLTGNGIIDNDNPESKYHYDAETGKLWFIIEDGKPAVELFAGFYLTFNEVIDEIFELGNIKIRVENSGSTETGPQDSVSKVAYDNISAIKGKFGAKGAALDNDYKNIGWRVDITHNEGIAGLKIDDRKTGDSDLWYFDSEDEERGLVMEFTVDGETYLANIPGVEWLEDSWTVTMPDTIEVDGKTIDLSTVTECSIYFTSTVTEPLDPEGTSGATYKNRATVEEKPADAYTRRAGGHGVGKGKIDKKVTKNWDDDPSIEWVITATIPGWDGRDEIIKGWSIKDEMQLRKGSTDSKLNVFNLLLETGGVTVKANGKPVEPIGSATGEFAWGVRRNTEGDDTTVMIELYHKCGCDALETTAIPDHTADVDGYCTYWTVTDNTTFTIEYTYDKAAIEKLIYGIAGDEIAWGIINSLYNSATLMHSKNNHVERKSASANFKPAVTKTLDKSDENEDILHFTITLNETRRDYGDLHQLVLTDKMSVGLSLIEDSVKVVANETQTVAHKVNYVAGRKNEFVLTILEVPTTNAMYVITYDVKVDRDELRSNNYVNEAEISLYGMTLTREISALSNLYVSSRVRDYALKLTKRSNSNALLSGAKFTFGEMDVVIAEDLETGKDGTVVIDTDSAGTYLLQHRGYYVAETEAPKGYKLDGERHWFMFCRDGKENCEKCEKVLEQIHEMDPKASVQIYRGPMDTIKLLTGEMTVVNNPTVTPSPVPTAVPVVLPSPTPTVEPTATPEPTPTPEPERTNVTGHKTWNDDDNANGTRPSSITVRLLRDGVVIDERTVTAQDGWSYTFNDLPVADENGNAYTYTVNERMVSGYYGQTDGYDLINTLLPDVPDTPDTPNTPNTPNTPYRPRIPSGFVTMRPNVDELESLIELFGYGTPLWGGLLPTGDEIPAYPYIFAGIGAAAIAVLGITSRKRRKQS